MTFQVALIGREGPVIGSDRLTNRQTQDEAFTNQSPTIEMGHQEKFITSDDGSLVCFFAGGPNCQNVAATRNGKDSNGIPYIVITCTECLRSFPLNVTTKDNPELLETPCLFCSNMVKYIIDFSLSVFSPTKVKAAPVISGKDKAS